MRIHPLLLATIAALAVVSAAAAAIRMNSFRPLSSASRMIGINLDPIVPGWMDNDISISDEDRIRLASFSARSHADNIVAIRAIQAGERASLTRRDFELMRQDRRRATAAYPDVPRDKLMNFSWYNVSYSDKVPASYCTSGNSSSTADSAGGPSYLDGPCFLGTVKPEFLDRADGPTTTKVLADLKIKSAADKLKDLTDHGYSIAMGGSGGSLSVDCKAGGDCVVVKASEWANRGKHWTFPYVASEWVNGPFQFETFASARNAVVVDIDVTSSGVVHMNSIGTTNVQPMTNGTVSETPPPPPVPQSPITR